MVASLNHILKIVIFLVLAAQPLLVFFDRYNLRDTDDKTVHYYCAAYTAAPEAKRNAVIEHLPCWVEQESRIQRKCRVAGRLAGAQNYTIMNLIMRMTRRWVCHSHPEAPPWQILAWAFKAATLGSIVLGMVYLLSISAICMRTVWPPLLVLAATALGVSGWDAVAPFPEPCYRPFWICSPRGIASLLLLTLFMTYAMQCVIPFIISALLLLLNHVGLTLAILPLIAVALAFTDGALLLAGYYPRKRRIRFIFPLLLFVLIGLVLAALISTFSVEVPRIPENVWRHGGTDSLPVILAWLVTFTLCMAATIIIGKRIRVRETEEPGSTTMNSLRFLCGHILFLCLAGAWCQALRLGCVRVWLSRLTGSHLVLEIADRLGAARYVVFVSVCAWGLWWIWSWLRQCPTPYTRRIGRGIIVLLVCAFLVSGFHKHHDGLYERAMAGELNFFKPDCMGINVIHVDETTLGTLQTAKEPEFFLSLAEFLFGDCSRYEPESISPDIR
jgi:hypothetical protein